MCPVSVLRAPVLVALALIECGMEYEDAVHFIRLWVQNTDSTGLNWNVPSLELLTHAVIQISFL